MNRFVKLTYIVIVILFLIAMSILGWYVIDERKDADTEIAEIRKQLDEIVLPKSDKKIETPDELIIVKEYDYKTPTDVVMKIVAFDTDSKVVWEYKTASTSMAEYSFDMLWPHFENVYSLENNKIVILNTFTGEVRAEVKLPDGGNCMAAGYYKGDLYALVDIWSGEGQIFTQKVLKIDKDGHIISSKQLDSTIYDGFDQTVEKVEITRIDESEIEIFVTRLDEKNVEYVMKREI